MFSKLYYKLGVSMTMGMLAFSGTAMAQEGGGETAGNNFSSIARNINDSIADFPGLLTSISYLLGILLGVLGVMKIKDHVENPTQTPMKEGAMRLAAGGALFALPIIFEAMSTTIGDGETVEAAKLKAATFNVE